jgi:hypothetical protein
MKSTLSMSRDLTGNWDDTTEDDEVERSVERSVEASM